jgi:hypothetical protein
MPTNSKEYSRTWRKANVEKVRAYARTWAKANPEKKRAYERARYKAKPGKKRSKALVWAKANPKKNCAKNRRRRARKLKAGGYFTTQQFIDLCTSYGNICLCCKRTEAELNLIGLMLVPDHIQALSRGGSNDISNIQPLCHGINGCNNHKWAKCVDYRSVQLSVTV